MKSFKWTATITGTAAIACVVVFVARAQVRLDCGHSMSRFSRWLRTSGLWASAASDDCFEISRAARSWESEREAGDFDAIVRHHLNDSGVRNILWALGDPAIRRRVDRPLASASTPR